MMVEEPGSIEEALDSAARAFQDAGISKFARAALPALVAKMRALEMEELEYLAKVLFAVAPVRSLELAKAVARRSTSESPCYEEPESTGARRTGGTE